MSETIRVLVRDDQMLIRTGLRTVIDARPDMEVVGECGNGEDAGDLCARLKPDVVVMDVRMPVLDGIEATRSLAGIGVAEPTKVLVVTTFNLDEYVYEALRAGASGFLLKDAPPARVRPNARVRDDLPLTSRELEVLPLIAEGLSNREIASALTLSPETIKTFVSRILTKLNLRDRVQAVVYAYRQGLVA